MAGSIIPEATEDVEEFIDKVDEVTRLIEGLKAGTISPEYIDTKIERKKQDEQEKTALAAKRPAGRGPASAPASALPAPGTDAPSTESADQDESVEADRKERAMAKVKELLANRERKLRARARYEEYVRSDDRTKFGTDYTKWDIWCPDDEEDDLINSIGPNTPQFRAMEKDIDERHRQMVERRQLAERCRVRGNEAYQARQYSEALRCYQQGLESERTNMALHANAAMAALKMSCFVQAIEHCDKVLSIAEFFHNNKKDPLCVKALQRRAEAYRSLQQHGRAVADLEAALEMDPANGEAAKQLATARQEEDEARKQRAITKAVRRGAAAAVSAAGEGSEATAAAGGKAGITEAAGLTLDLEKLGRLERLAASLAPSAESVPVSGTSEAGPEAGSGAAAAGGSGEASTINVASSAQRGPILPPRPAKGSGPAAGAANGGARGGADGSAVVLPESAVSASTAGVCSQLRSLLKGDDACCVYFRECGGLQHVATRVGKRPAGSNLGLDLDLPALLLLLNDACMNEGNLKQLPALKVLPAAVGALDGAGEEAAAASATLLCTAVTNEDVRKEVSKVLGAGDNLSRLVTLLSGAKPVVQGVGLALLANCMLDKPVKAAMAAAWRKDAAAAGCFLALLRAPNPVLAEKAVVLLGNMATDATLRGEVLAQQGGVVRQLVCLTTITTCGAAAGAEGEQAGNQPPVSDLQRAASTALFNFSADEAGQKLVAEDSEGLAALYGLVQPLHTDRPLAARAAGVCARAAKVASGAGTLLKLGALEGMLQVMGSALDGLGMELPTRGSVTGQQGDVGQDTGPAGGGGDQEANIALLDAAVRTVTILTSADDPALGARLVAASGVAVLLRTIRAASASGRGSAGAPSGGSGLGESVLANAVLCLAGVARRKEHLPLLREADPVPALVGVAYEGRGNTASKNAAIALARLAQEPTMLERLRELHGIEIIYQYVKP
ncbi:hypothetical protein GPECTOR_1g473 [Gonium pectorale]|uniref:Uncharacterized protein n=1 Tax=Gonium pectorale TaxID=33097 RepID=A0A150H2X4_GONPE|nr:hypothetical protein GPECTOR_1g473 [Gonium pectorale]|eukprot:KXZ56527.1 hypothetical protein GPECTOR_1g473 [Gonium pectorale]